MGKSKEQWFEEQQNKRENWVTKKCSNCGCYYKVNKVTKKEKSSEIELCDDCYEKIILGK